MHRAVLTVVRDYANFSSTDPFLPPPPPPCTEQFLTVVRDYANPSSTEPFLPPPPPPCTEQVLTVVRDYANPSSTDPFLPFARYMEWWEGHSWTTGLGTPSGDGMNQVGGHLVGMAWTRWGGSSGDGMNQVGGSWG